MYVCWCDCDEKSELCMFVCACTEKGYGDVSYHAQSITNKQLDGCI
jgi:hypothetical protein